MIIRKSKPEKNEAMKTMKKILSIAALALTGALMTSCGTVTIGGTVYAGGITTSPYTYEPSH